VNLHPVSRSGSVAAVVVAVFCLVACGSGSPPRKPLDVLRAFNSALARGDGKKACGLLAARRRAELVESRNQGCAETLAALSKPDNIEAPAVKSLSSARLGRMTIVGDTATVEVTTGYFGTSIAQLERQKGGEWRVTESAAATGFL
jgi:hypothetical protein